MFDDVDYSAVYPDLNYHRLRKTKDGLVHNLVFCKSQEWAHEKEFRIFRRKVGRSAAAFPRELITRVIFGCKSQADDILLVKGWLKNWPSDVVLAKAETSRDKFELTIADFETIKGI